MAAVYSNPLNLFNLTAKGSPVGDDLVPIGDSAVTGVPLKQCTITQLLSVGGGSPGLVFIATATASGSATIDFGNNLSATYDNYIVICENWFPANNGVTGQLRVGTGAGPTYQTTSYIGVVGDMSGSTVACAVSGTGALNMCKSAAMSSTTTTTVGCFELLVTNVNNATNNKSFKGHVTYNSTGAAVSVGIFSGNWQNATVLTSLRFLMSAGNIATGVFKLYGIKNS